jgi:hypothetical protein
MNRLLSIRHTNSKQMLQKVVENARRLTVCLDGWTKNSLSCSYLGISACLFDTGSRKARHIVMSIKQLDHPHTGEALAAAAHEYLTEWHIDDSKVMMVVTDNGSNVLKAVRLLSERVRWE